MSSPTGRSSRSSDSSEVVIAGAGIGGLALACALRRSGRAVRVFERAPELGPVGAGIAMQCNAMAALKRIGLDEPVRAAGAEITRAVLRAPDGRVLSTTPLEPLVRDLGAPVIALHRARLHRVLLEAAGDGTVETGRAVEGYETDGRRVRVLLAGGASVETDLLVGADGLRSAVRAQMVGDGEPRYSGYTSWRGLSPRASLAPLGQTSETWGRGARFGIVPVGHGEVYWFAVANAPPGGRSEDARAELIERFGRWHEPVRELIASTPPECILRTDISDRKPLDRWSSGRVTLLGDAAHPMTPNLGQGGCQAVEDVVVLAECLVRAPDAPAALAEYERRRVPRANRIVLASRRMGAVAQWSNPIACWLRDLAFRMTPPGAFERQARDLLTLPS